MIHEIQRKIIGVWSPNPLYELRDIIREGGGDSDNRETDYIQFRSRIESFVGLHGARLWNRPKWSRRCRQRDRYGNRPLIDPFIVLPPEIIRTILEYCSAKFIARAARVCRSWRVYCYDTLLWRNKIVTDRIHTGRKMPLFGAGWREVYATKQMMYRSFRFFEFGIAIRQQVVDVVVSDDIMLTLNGISIANEVRLWDLSKNRPFDIQGHFGGTFQEFSREITRDHTIAITCGNLDNGQLFLGFSNGEVAIVLLQNFSVRRVSAHVGYVWQIKCTDKHVVSRGYDHRVTIIDRNGNKPAEHIHCPGEPICIGAGSNTVFASTGRGLLAWNIETKEKIKTGCSIASNLLTCTTRHRVICGASHWGTVKAWDLTTQRFECNLHFPGQLIYSIYDHIVAFGDEYNVEFYDFLMGKTLVRVNVKAHHGFGEDCHIQQVAFNLKFGVLALTNGYIMALDFRDPEIDGSFYKYLMP